MTRPVEKKIRVRLVFMYMPHILFQDLAQAVLEYLSCQSVTDRRTDALTDRRTDGRTDPNQYAPSTSPKLGGIKIPVYPTTSNR